MADLSIGKSQFAGALGLYTIGGLFWAFLPYFVGLNVTAGGLTQAQAGMLGTSYLAVFSLTSLTSMWWLPRYDWRALALGASAVVVVALVMLARSESYAASMSLAALIGVSMGSFWTIAYRIFSGTASPERSFALGIVVSYSALALVSYVIGNFIIPDYGLKGSSYFLGALIAVLSFSCALIPRRIFEQADSNSAGLSLTPPLPVALALLAILGTALAFAAVWAFAERIGTAAGFDHSQVSPVIASNLLASAAGSVLAAAVGMRVGRNVPLMAGMLLMLIFILILAKSEIFWVYAASIIGLGLAIGFVLPYQMGNLAALDTDSRFVMLIAAAQGIGSAIGPVIGGSAADRGGVELLVVVTTGVLLFSAVAILLTLRKQAKA